MGQESKEYLYLNINQEIDDFFKHLDETIEKQQQELKASKKKNELETKFAQELKLHNELNQRLEELNRRGNDLDRVCATFESRLTIADSDKNRLDSAQEAYQLAKELTGIRLEFEAPPNVAKGYVKNESRKLLQAFEFDMGGGFDSGALWDVIKHTAAPGWPWPTGNENKPNNYL
ncbi:hypothetical protein K1T71_014366 [Dendrolimus kikuchii]|uniref:Uncharacterized protein n=1 Tax=Dendrolimus kikuchii TaxID=765133 RepID=A0ACC1CDM1_9NEOP|nr:hypothetical protein K1T71_014366 [Dendrolimus kikuchii]